jgi:hypothetical protein
MSYSNEYYRDIGKRLEALRGLFASMPENNKNLGFYDIYLAANELELALHTLCDFLLEPTSPNVSDSALEQIQLLHRMMKIDDCCVQKLKEKQLG